MPPEDSVRPWMLIYYSKDTDLKGEKFWQEYGKQTFSRLQVVNES